MFLVIMLKRIAVAVALHTPLQAAHQLHQPHQLKRGQVQAVAVAHQVQAVIAWQAS